MSCQIVIGLGYGDEGKGLLTDFLCRQADRPLVVRFSGGHQAGHTVVTAHGHRHVFSNFGAGTFAGAPTFWSNYCTFHPIGYANELSALQEMGIEPLLYVDGKTAVTTPYDLLFNRQLEKKQKHGSCGLGFGATVARHEGPHKIHVQDLLDDFVLEQKLKTVAAYYQIKQKVNYDEAELTAWMNRFNDAVTVVRKRLRITSALAFFKNIYTRFDKIVFEGSQGLLLDEEFGYFPHVTRAQVSSKNAIQLISSYGLGAVGFCTSAGRDAAADTLVLARSMSSSEPGNITENQVTEVQDSLSDVEIHYVTRAYQTRHGNGPLSNQNLNGLELTPTPLETNQFNPWQGEQRRSLLDINQLRYALQCDAHYAAGLARHLIVTCLDQLTTPWKATEDRQPTVLSSVAMLARHIGGEWAGLAGNYGEVGNLKDGS